MAVSGASERDPDLLREFGLPFLAYVCASDEPTIATRLVDGVRLDPPQEAALDRLLAIAGTSTPVPPGWGVARHRVKGILLAQTNDSDTEFQELRERCGGGVESQSSTDPVAGPLLRIGRDVYPLLLVPRGEPAYPFSWELPTQIYLSDAARGHRDAAEFERAVMADADLRRLFPADDPTNGRCGFIVASTGTGAWTYLTFLSAAIIEHTWWERRFATGRMPTLGEVQTQLPATLARFRTLARGFPIGMPARVGLNGFALHRQRPLETDAGVMRVDTHLDDWLVPAPARRSALGEASSSGHPFSPSFIEAFGEQPFFLDPDVAIDYGAPVVLESTIDLTIQIFVSPQPVNPLAFSCQALLANVVESVQLGVLIAVRDQAPLLTSPSWWALLEPFGGVKLQWSELPNTRLLSHMPRAITETYFGAVRGGIDRVVNLRMPTLDLAIRRTLTAFVDRHAPTDKIIDAVIAWENLFGPSNGKQVSKRVSRALANLLAKGDVTKASALFSEVRDLYDLRSRLVHGDVVDDRRIETGLPRVLDLTREALCELFESRPELIGAADRGETLRAGP